MEKSSETLNPIQIERVKNAQYDHYWQTKRATVKLSVLEKIACHFRVKFRIVYNPMAKIIPKN